MTDHLRTELCLDALRPRSAPAAAGHIDGVIFHSDHGMPVHRRTTSATRAELGITQSMGTVGDTYDNAMAESFFAS